MLFADSIPDPLHFLAERDCDGVLAMIVRTQGPSYRDVGAMMAFAADGSRTGSLSSGCIEADLAIHAMAALEAGEPVTIRYGAGSPWIDLRLPCGGGMEVLLLPRPDAQALAETVARIDARQPVTLEIENDTGAIALGDAPTTGWKGHRFCRRLLPRLSFQLFGNGAEAERFAALVDAMGYPVSVHSPDPALNVPCPVVRLHSPQTPPPLHLDRWTAAILFFHDHEWEPPILKSLVESPAFYIGAQGSRTARVNRDAALRDLGVEEAAISRIAGPIGLIPSAREPGTLAVSVLAEVMDRARHLLALT